MVLSATFNNISVGGLLGFFQVFFFFLFNWWWNSDKTTDLWQGTDKLYHMMFYRVHLAMSWIRTHNVNGNRN